MTVDWRVMALRDKPLLTFLTAKSRDTRKMTTIFPRAAERLSRPSLDDTHGHIAAFRVIYGIHQRRRRPSKEVSCGRASLPSNNAIDSSSTATIKSTLRPVLCEPAAPHYLPHPRCLPRYGRPISFDPSLIRIERACRKLSARYCR